MKCTQTSLVVQCLRLYAFTAGGMVRFLVGELRSLMLCSVDKKKTKTNKLHRFFNGNYELALGSSEILMISECVVLPRGKVWKR